MVSSHFPVCPLQLEWDTESYSPEWDSFLESAPGGHHEQTSRWGQVRSAYGWKAGRLLFREKDCLVAGAQILIRPLRQYLRWGYITYGPVLLHHDPALVSPVLLELKRTVKKLGLAFAVVGLPYNGHAVVGPLVRAGFLPKPRVLQPKFVQTTCVIDLSRSPEELMSHMRRSTRQNVRTGLRKGISVTERGESDLDLFRDLMIALCRRRGTPPNPAQADFFHNLWQQFSPKGWIRLFLAANDQEPVSAGLAFTFNGWFRVWKVGWSGSLGHLKPNEVLWWQMIRWAKERDYRWFDFVDIDPVEAGSISEGGSADNVTGFKLGLGGEIVELPGAFFYASNRLVKMALRLGLMRLLISPVGQRFIGSLASSC